MTAAPVTLLFTDLVDSTALLQRVGAEGGQRILHAHRQLLRETLASHCARPRLGESSREWQPLRESE